LAVVLTNSHLGAQGDDGRLYTTFDTDEAGAAAFIEAAEYYGLDDEARGIVEMFNS
jgi:hypothetical protein